MVFSSKKSFYTKIFPTELSEQLWNQGKSYKYLPGHQKNPIAIMQLLLLPRGPCSFMLKINLII